MTTPTSVASASLGSTAVGVPLYERAARRMARVQLELGGKNPAVVFDCSDLEGAAREIVAAAFLCSGQRCTALSRVIVSAEQAEGLVERLVGRIEKIRVGDGLLETTTMGPLVNRETTRHRRRLRGTRRPATGACPEPAGGASWTLPTSRGTTTLPLSWKTCSPTLPWLGRRSSAPCSR